MSGKTAVLKILLIGHQLTVLQILLIGHQLTALEGNAGGTQVGRWRRSTSELTVWGPVSYPDTDTDVNDDSSPRQARPEGSYTSSEPSREDAFRTFSGFGNNRFNKDWGAANSTLERLLPAKYSNGEWEVRRSRDGSELPSARLLSTHFFYPGSDEDQHSTLLTMQWGQLISHDMASAASTTQTRPPYTDCCALDADTCAREEFCLPIEVPDDDPVYSPLGHRCLNFVRSATDHGGPHSRPADQVVQVSHYLDASFLYGSSKDAANSLREFSGGRLRTELKDGRVFPPPAEDKMNLCDIQDHTDACYFTGDTRANQNPNLAVLQIVFLREHNRVAGELADLNPDWSDERTYHEARRIVIAELQHITYQEYLPIILGRTVWSEMNTSYQETVNPSTINSFTTAAFRYYHSNIGSYLRLVDDQGASLKHLRLSDHFERPGQVEQGNNLDDLLRGMTTQAQENTDHIFSEEIFDYLFRKGRVGQDLVAIDIQRGRDHGLAAYNDFRELQGQRRAVVFQDFADVMSQQNAMKLAEVYAHPDDVDVMVGGMLEYAVEDASAGPTFLWIMAAQFYRKRAGDRYFYDNKRQVYPFNSCQLAEIRKASVSRLLCDNSDRISEMQPRGFRMIGPNNKLTACPLLPAVDLSLWTQRGHFQCTEAK